MPTISTEDLQRAETYLCALNRPEDRWILEEPRQYLKISDLGEHLFGLNPATISNMCTRGEIPDAVLVSQQAGWRLSRLGIIYYIAQQRRATEQRQSSAG